MGQWYPWLCRAKAEHDEATIIPQRNVSRRPPMAMVAPCLSTSEWKTSGGEFHGCYQHQASWYSWYPDVSLTNFDEIWREITDINIFGFRDFCRCQRWKLRSPGYPLPGKKSTTGKATIAPAPPRPPPRPVWNSVKPGFNHHFPHEFVWKITVKTCKNPNLMANIFSHNTSLVRRYLLFPDSWMVDDLWTASQCFTCFMGFFGLDGFLAVKLWNH